MSIIAFSRRRDKVSELFQSMDIAGINSMTNRNIHIPAWKDLPIWNLWDAQFFPNLEIMSTSFRYIPHPCISWWCWFLPLNQSLMLQLFFFLLINRTTIRREAREDGAEMGTSRECRRRWIRETLCIISTAKTKRKTRYHCGVSSSSHFILSGR